MKKTLCYQLSVLMIGALICLAGLFPAVKAFAEEEAYYALSVSESTIDYGDIGSITLGAERTFTVTNNSNVSVTLTWWEENPANAFIIDLLSDGYLSPGASATFSVNPTQMLPEGSYYCAFYISAAEDINDDYLASVNMFMTIDDPDPISEVTQVVVSPDYATVEAGMSCSFHADIYGQNIQDYSVDWSISGNQSSGTYISDGFLQVAADETASNITVTAYSRQDSNVYNSVNVAVQRSESTVRVSASPSEGGSVSGGGKVNYGGKVILNAKPKSGYAFEGFYENNSKISSSASLEINGITSDRAITAVFVRNSFTINAYVNPQNAGTVSGIGTYEKGKKVELKASAAKGYLFTGWTKEGQLKSTDSTYQIGSIDSDLSLVANFEKKAANVYVIKAGAGEGGVISPSGDQNVIEGNDVSYIITTHGGYNLDKVLVDGKSVGAVSSYTFSNVQGPHTISASFVKEQESPKQKAATKTDSSKKKSSSESATDASSKEDSLDTDSKAIEESEKEDLEKEESKNNITDEEKPTEDITDLPDTTEVTVDTEENSALLPESGDTGNIEAEKTNKFPVIVFSVIAVGLLAAIGFTISYILRHR
ncbi:MAG: hypothetical protein E7307_03525 [Butyrivibrio sp.]|nr:hypothetical protein [Butyrivibrio sp.]